MSSENGDIPREKSELRENSSTAPQLARREAAHPWTRLGIATLNFFGARVGALQICLHRATSSCRLQAVAWQSSRVLGLFDRGTSQAEMARMKTFAIAQQELPPYQDQMFCLRQRDSELFWDGEQWATGLPSARGYWDLECALAIASRFSQQPIDLLVVFPTRQRSVTIPLGREGR